MGRILVIFALLCATPAAAQSFEQYESRQRLDQSNKAVTQSLPASRDATSATINSRIERQQLDRNIAAQQQMLRAQPPLLRPLR